MFCEIAEKYYHAFEKKYETELYYEWLTRKHRGEPSKFLQPCLNLVSSKPLVTFSDIT